MIDNRLFFIGKPSPFEEKKFDYSHDWVHLIDTFKKYVKKDFIVLEIGSSTLVKVKAVAAYCGQLTGLELFKNRVLEDFANVKFVNGDWQNLSAYFTENTFDIIISSHVIEHVKDDIKAFNEAFKVLKKGGHLIINTPNRNRLAQVFIEFFKGKRIFPFWEHEREYIKNDIISLIKKSSFSDCKYQITGLTWGLHGGPFWFYLKKFPKFLENYSGFWEIDIEK